MSKLKEAMDSYFNGRDKIFKLFGTHGWEEIEDQTHVKWIEVWGGINFFDEEGTEYSWESASKSGSTIDGIELYYVYENGDKFYVLLDENKKISEEEFEELEN